MAKGVGVRATLAAIALGALSGAAGCGGNRAECAALATKINAGSERLRAFEAEKQDRRSLGAKTTAQEMRKLADLYAEIGASLAEVQIKNADLKIHADSYVAAVKSSSQSARTLATAIENDRRDEARKADEIFDRSVNDQKAALDRINGVCGGK